VATAFAAASCESESGGGVSVIVTAMVPALLAPFLRREAAKRKVLTVPSGFKVC